MSFIANQNNDGALIMLGDMPYITSDHINHILAQYKDNESVCVPHIGERRGNPILWGRAYFTALTKLQGDQGARALLRQCHITPVSMDAFSDGGAILRDIDSPEALA